MIRRRVSEDDKEIMRLIKAELFPFARKTFPSVSVNMAELKARLNRGKVYIAEESSKPNTKAGARAVGGFLSTQNKRPDLWIDMLAIGKSLQGKGLGTALMELAEKDGRSEGCQTSNLFVDASNSRAQYFYAKRGYFIVQYINEIGCYQMKKQLM